MAWLPLNSASIKPLSFIPCIIVIPTFFTPFASMCVSSGSVICVLSHHYTLSHRLRFTVHYIPLRFICDTAFSQHGPLLREACFVLSVRYRSTFTIHNHNLGIVDPRSEENHLQLACACFGVLPHRPLVLRGNWYNKAVSRYYLPRPFLSPIQELS